MHDLTQSTRDDVARSMTPKALCIACALALSAIVPAHAAEPDTDTVHELDKVTVEEFAEENGRTTLSAVELDMLPSTTGTISDALRGQSFIQFDALSRRGTLGGEITPPQISIRGSRTYENAFLINGMSNNNNISPTGWSSFDAYGRAPDGDAQAIMLDTDMLESLTVYSENISAEYGDFTGGVVDAQIRDAKMDRWHASVWARHTRDSWAKMHYTPGSDEETNQRPSATDQLQKEFRNTFGGVSLEGPLFDGKMGAMISYQKTHSSVPVWKKFGDKYERDVQNRDKDTFMLRLNTDDESDFYVSSMLMYSPYEATYHINRKDGDYSTNGGGLNFTLNTRANLSFGKWTNDLAWAKTEVSREADSTVSYNGWLHDLPDGSTSGYVDWTDDEDGDEGLQGDHEQNQETLQYKSILTLNPIETGFIKHNFRVGGEILYTKVDSKQEAHDVYRYHSRSANAPQYAPNVQGNKADGIIAGEQWLNRRFHYDAVDMSADYTSYAAFLEDQIEIERFTFRPAVRVSYDDVTENVNVAPRFAFKADVLNNGRYFVTGGFNRYYGTEVLSYALTADVNSSTWNRQLNEDGTVTDWVETESADPTTYSDLSNLDTPYSDEYVLGFSANVLDGTIVSLQAVKRNYKDQLSSEESTRDGYDFEMRNGGESSYEGITLSIEKAFDLGKWGKHRTALGITRSDVEGNSSVPCNWNTGWHQSTDLDAWGMGYNTQYVYIDGVKTKADEIPADNFNSDWVVTYTHDASFMDDRLRSSLLLRFETTSDSLQEEFSWPPFTGPDGQMYHNFKTVENDNLFNADLTVAYDLIKTTNQTMTVSLEALNLFDRKNTYNVWGRDNYSMGRQFFLEMRYTY